MAGGKGGGGAWKVAYADFVTAMMALFMVLWISSQSEEVLIATSEYFANPFHMPLGDGQGVLTGEGSGRDNEQSMEDALMTSVVDLALLHQIAQEFYKMLNLEESDENKPVEIIVTSDGLRVIVYNRSENPVFHSGTAELTDWGTFALQNLAWLLERHPMDVRIDAHDMSRPPEDPVKDSWGLSVDRANRTRSTLVHFALDGAKIRQVSGFADSRPLENHPPDDPENERVEISLMPR